MIVILIWLVRMLGDERYFRTTRFSIMFALPVLLAALAGDPAPPKVDPAKPGDEKTIKSRFKPDFFNTLVNPQCSHCVDEAKLKGDEIRQDDRVLAWIRGKYEGGAIPYRWFLVPYRVISDSYGVFVYDADAGFTRGWPASYDYRFHGWRNGVMVMRHKDGTIFDCLTGLAIDGPRKGEKLEPLPTLETDWGLWLKIQPATVAYRMFPKYQPSPLPTEVTADSRQTRPAPDPRLKDEERVFGLSIGGKSLAWPLRQFGAGPELKSVKIGEQKALILWNGGTRTAAAFAPETEGERPESVTLKLDSTHPEAPWVDEETGSRWTIAGRSISGSRKGQTLRWLPGVMVKWYAWAAEYPETGIAGDKI